MKKKLLFFVILALFTPFALRAEEKDPLLETQTEITVSSDEDDSYEIDYDELQYQELPEPEQNEKTQAFWEQVERTHQENEDELKKRVFLIDYQKDKIDKIEPKSDDFWDLAWHARSADMGDKESQYVIAKAYEEGKSVAQNPQKAVAFYKKAGESGHIEAAMALARIYRENKWIEADLDKALYWYEKAAANNYVPAQIKASQIYEDLDNLDKAYEYMQKAMLNMYPDGKDLEEKSPDLKRLGEKIKQEKERVAKEKAEQEAKEKAEQEARIQEAIRQKIEAEIKAKEEAKKAKEEAEKAKLLAPKPLVHTPKVQTIPLMPHNPY